MKIVLRIFSVFFALVAIASCFLFTDISSDGVVLAAVKVLGAMFFAIYLLNYGIRGRSTLATKKSN
jgi:hypothetical protein